MTHRVVPTKTFSVTNSHTVCSYFSRITNRTLYMNTMEPLWHYIADKQLQTYHEHI